MERDRVQVVRTGVDDAACVVNHVGQAVRPEAAPCAAVDIPGHEIPAAGAAVAWRSSDKRGNAVVMRDPEGNGFCVT
jgi:hypothetical protein